MRLPQFPIQHIFSLSPMISVCRETSPLLIEFIARVLPLLLLFQAQFVRVQSNWWNLALISWKDSISNNESYSVASGSSNLDHNRNLVQRETSWENSVAQYCYHVKGLSRGQSSICRENIDQMPAVSEGVRASIVECQHQFRYQRWNCRPDKELNRLKLIAEESEGASLFGDQAKALTKENAFVHAIAAAGVVHSIARVCKQASGPNNLNSASFCSCSASPINNDKPNYLPQDWEWSGCSDSIEYAYQFAEKFIDIKEKEKSLPRGSQELAQSLMNLRNNAYGRDVAYRAASVNCKCHGVSSSCSMRTCWKQLVPFSKIGQILAKSYNEAVPVQFNRRGTKLRRESPANVAQERVKRNLAITESSMVYLQESTNLCLQFGAGDRRKYVRQRKSFNKSPLHGRECLPEIAPADSSTKKSSILRMIDMAESSGHRDIQSESTLLVNNQSSDNFNHRPLNSTCSEICCNGRFEQRITEVVEKCNCQFHWCCQLQCEECVKTVVTYHCL